MTPSEIRFDDGAAYERYMGAWSQLVGTAFLDWLAPPAQLRWLDVGCGNGAFTETLLERCAPAAVQGIDPSEAQLAYARTRLASPVVRLRQGDAMAQPFPDDAFDAAVMPLVIFFVPDPATGVAEMARVVRAGGTVAAYAWDMTGGGFPYDAVQTELRALGLDLPVPPSPEASRIDVLRGLWSGAGLDAVETREITVHRTFADFDDYWTTILGGPSVGRQLAAIPPGELARFRARLRDRLPAADDGGRITASARANAVRGRVPPARTPTRGARGATDHRVHDTMEAPDHDPVGLATFLGTHGFVAVPLGVNAVGHFEIAAAVNGQPARLLLDTGASHTVLASPSAARLGLRTTPSAERAGGVGAADHATETALVAELRLGDVRLRDVAAWTFDLEHVNRALVARGGAPIDGAVGGDVLRRAEAVIDYARATLYLRVPASHSRPSSDR